MTDFFVSAARFFSRFLSKEWAVFIISLFPVLEIRGGLIAAHFLDIPWLNAFFICLTANILPVVFILLFTKKLLRWMKNTKLFSALAVKLEKRAKKKSGSIEDPWVLRVMLHTKGFRRMGERLKEDEKYRSKILLRCKLFALFLFVAIPIPGTGAWTGSIIAALADLRIKHALPVITIGIVTAGFIMALLTYGLLGSLGIG
ncbi:MAG: small multi-drug export protein [Clostridia bacterium]|nr:small multi-drug export protein [Clostridia bacterium]